MYRVLAGKPEGKRPTGRTGKSGIFGLVHVLGVKVMDSDCHRGSQK